MILAIDIGNTTVTLGGVRTAPQQAYSLEFTARIDINHTDRKSTRLNSSHSGESRMPSSA